MQPTREECKQALSCVLTKTRATLFLRSFDIINKDSREKCLDYLLDKVIIPMMDEMEETEGVPYKWMFDRFKANGR